MDLRTLLVNLLFKRVYTPQPGPGAKRAAARLAAKREANKAIPNNMPYSRQQARAEKRAIFKQLRSMRKATVMQERRPGGSATVQ